MEKSSTLVASSVQFAEMRKKVSTLLSNACLQRKLYEYSSYSADCTRARANFRDSFPRSSRSTKLNEPATEATARRYLECPSRNSADSEHFRKCYGNFTLGTPPRSGEIFNWRALLTEVSKVHSRELELVSLEFRLTNTGLPVYSDEHNSSNFA